jgi:hypothetical protein
MIAINVFLALLMTVVAIGVFLRGANTDFQPARRTQLLLFVVGFLSMFAWGQVLFYEFSRNTLWLNMLMATLFGLFWALTAPKRWRFIQHRMEKNGR